MQLRLGKFATSGGRKLSADCRIQSAGRFTYTSTLEREVWV